LPKQASPPKPEKHVPCTGIEVTERKTGFLRYVPENRVDGSTADTHHPDVDHGTEERKVLSML
jgi:hypothetical protein